MRQTSSFVSRHMIKIFHPSPPPPRPLPAAFYRCSTIALPGGSPGRGHGSEPRRSPAALRDSAAPRCLRQVLRAGGAARCLRGAPLPCLHCASVTVCIFSAVRSLSCITCRPPPGAEAVFLRGNPQSCYFRDSSGILTFCEMLFVVVVEHVVCKYRERATAKYFVVVLLSIKNTFCFSNKPHNQTF